MSSVAGPCEWCGGPQKWTVRNDVMYVRCALGCLGLFDELLPLPDGEGKRGYTGGRGLEPTQQWRGRESPEGGEADVVTRDVLVHIGVPLKAVLRNLWEGGSWREVE